MHQSFISFPLKATSFLLDKYCSTGSCLFWRPLEEPDWMTCMWTWKDIKFLYYYYSAGTTAASILHNRAPSLLYDLLLENNTMNSRNPGQRTFFDTSSRKIGRQSLQNRLKEPFTNINEDWYMCGITKGTMRVVMKKAFFPYYEKQQKTKNPSWIVKVLFIIVTLVNIFIDKSC